MKGCAGFRWIGWLPETGAGSWGGKGRATGGTNQGVTENPEPPAARWSGRAAAARLLGGCRRGEQGPFDEGLDKILGRLAALLCQLLKSGLVRRGEVLSDGEVDGVHGLVTELERRIKF